MSPPARLAEIRGLMGQLDRQLATALQERAKLSREIRSLVEQGGGAEEREARDRQRGSGTGTGTGTFTGKGLMRTLERVRSGAAGLTECWSLHI